MPPPPSGEKASRAFAQRFDDMNHSEDNDDDYPRQQPQFGHHDTKLGLASTNNNPRYDMETANMFCETALPPSRSAHASDNNNNNNNNSSSSGAARKIRPTPSNEYIPESTGETPFAIEGRAFSFDMDPVEPKTTSALGVRSKPHRTPSKRQLVRATRRPFSVNRTTTTNTTTSDGSSKTLSTNETQSDQSGSSSSSSNNSKSNARKLALEALAASRRHR